MARAPKPHQREGVGWGHGGDGAVEVRWGGSWQKFPTNFYAKSEMETSSHFPFPLNQCFQAPAPPRSL